MFNRSLAAKAKCHCSGCSRSFLKLFLVFHFDIFGLFGSRRRQVCCNTLWRLLGNCRNLRSCFDGRRNCIFLRQWCAHLFSRDQLRLCLWEMIDSQTREQCNFLQRRDGAQMWNIQIHTFGLQTSPLSVVFRFRFRKVVFVQIQIIIRVLQSFRRR